MDKFKRKRIQKKNISLFNQKVLIYKLVVKKF